MTAPLLHTPEEAAETLRCKESWLKDQARQRNIPFTLVGGAYHFSRKHLEWIVDHFEVLPEQRQTAPAPRRKAAAEPLPTGMTPLQARPSKRLQAVTP